MSDLAGDLERLTDTGSAKQRDYSLPAGWAPSVAYSPDGRAEVTTLGAGVPAADDWTEEVRALGVTVPDGWRCRLVEVRHDPAAWVRRGQGQDAETEAVTRRRWVVEPARGKAGLDELLEALGKRRPKPRPRETGAPCPTYPVADLQLGKVAYGEGTAETVQRTYDSLELALDKVKRWQRRHGNGELLMPWLGDLCEGVVSQKGAVALASDLTVTEQQRVARRLLLEHIKALAPLTERLVVPIAPGNHDQPHRLLGTAPRGDDSWAVEAAVAVADALALAGGYEHVEIVTPDVDELTVTVEVAGTVVGCAHGHQFRAGKGHTWLAEQAHARTRVGAADVLMTGHYHEFAGTFSSGRFWFQAPTQDPGSPWWDQQHGGGGTRGSFVLLLEGGRPLDLAWC